MDDRQWGLTNPVMWIVAPALVIVIALAIFGTAGDGGPAWPVALVMFIVMITLGGYLRIRSAPEHLVITWWPIWRRRIPWADIEEARSVAYRMRDFGGWGIRLNRRAIAYSVWSKHAIRMRIRGKRFDVIFTTLQQQAWLDEMRGRGVPVVTESTTP